MTIRNDELMSRKVYFEIGDGVMVTDPEDADYGKRGTVVGNKSLVWVDLIDNYLTVFTADKLSHAGEINDYAE